MSYAIMTDAGWLPYVPLSKPIKNDIPVEDFGRMYPRAHEHDADIKDCAGNSAFPNLNKLLSSRQADLASRK